MNEEIEREGGREADAYNDMYTDASVVLLLRTLQWVVCDFGWYEAPKMRASNAEHLWIFRFSFHLI